MNGSARSALNARRNQRIPVTCLAVFTVVWVRSRSRPADRAGLAPSKNFAVVHRRAGRDLRVTGASGSRTARTSRGRSSSSCTRSGPTGRYSEVPIGDLGRGRVRARAQPLRSRGHFLFRVLFMLRTAPRESGSGRHAGPVSRPSLLLGRGRRAVEPALRGARVAGGRGGRRSEGRHRLPRHRRAISGTPRRTWPSRRWVLCWRGSTRYRIDRRTRPRAAPEPAFERSTLARVLKS